MHPGRENSVRRCWWQLRRLVLEGWLVMTKLSRPVIACISATMMLLGVPSIAGADTFTYRLHNNLNDTSGPPLVSYGGALTPSGYFFGVDQGLSLSGSGAFNVYSIDIHFYFDNVSASINGYQQIIDFKNRTSDSGLYSHNGALVLFSTGNGASGDPFGETAGQVFTNGTMADLLITRDASGLFSTYVNGSFAFSAMDMDGATTFSGP